MGREDLALRAERAADAGASSAASPLSIGRGREWGRPRLAEGLMAAILALLAARFFWLLIAPLPVPAIDELAAAQPTAEAELLEVKSPFGAAASPAETAPDIAETAPDISETALDLTLTGVWADNEGGSAIIKLPEGQQKRFVIGDEIIDGVKLEAVYPDQVIIRRAGVREALRFETKEAGSSTDAPPLRAPAQGGANPREKGSRANRDSPANLRATGIGGLASIFRVAPGADENGKLTIELYASRNRGAFERLGLKDGDRLISINGHPPPANPAALSSVLSNLQRRSSASLVIERGGKEIPITISLANIGFQ